MNSYNTLQQQQAEQTFWLFFIGGVFVMAVFCAIVGSIIGDSKGKRTEGALLGLLLGVIGLIAIAVMKDDRPGAQPVAVQAVPQAGPAGWHPDPYGKHQLRYFDGTSWREQVSDSGVVSSDIPPPPVVPTSPPPPVSPYPS